MLVADLYELTMAAGYYRRGMVAPATFSLFARKLPERRGFLVASGVDEALDRIAGWEVTRADVDRIVHDMGWPAELLASLRGRRFTGEVWAVAEGSVVLADEPLLEVTAPLPEAQLVETTALNAVTYQTALATKAARCHLAVRGRPVIDFSLRRTHGVEAGLAAARAGGLVGFAATSNVAAAGRFGLGATGMTPTWLPSWRLRLGAARPPSRQVWAPGRRARTSSARITPSCRRTGTRSRSTPSSRASRRAYGVARGLGTVTATGGAGLAAGCRRPASRSTSLRVMAPRFPEPRMVARSSPSVLAR
jgi:nicotinate phosphoribosyltransferase family protein